MSAHDTAFKAREDARRAMLEATAEVSSLRNKLVNAERVLVTSRATFLDADRKFQQLLAADSAGVLGNVAQVEHAPTSPKA